MRTTTIILSSFLFSISGNGFSQQAGDLDVTFDTDGKLTTSFGTGWDEVRALAVQTDGKIIAAGYSDNGSNSDFALVRYNADGSLDNNFGTSGKVTTDFNTGTEEAYSIAIQQDGKIVVAGNTGIFSTGLARYNSDGSLDLGFGTSGIISTNFSHVNEKTPLAIQSDGKILVGGTYSPGPNTSFALARYNVNGTPDNTFGTSGQVNVSIGPNDDKMTAIAIQPDGKIVAAGNASNGTDHDFALARFNQDGTFDNTFNGTGHVILAFSSSDDLIYSLAIQSDGKIIAVGSTGSGFNADFALARFNADGTSDNTFSSDGKETTAIGTIWDCAYSATIQSDGKIVVAGYASVGGDHFALARYNTNGTLDNSFSTDGMLTTTISTGNDGAFAIAMQPDGKIIAAGFDQNTTDRNFALVRYVSGLNAGVGDFLTHENIRIYPNPVQRDLIVEYDLSQNEVLSIELRDINGRLIRTLAANIRRNTGTYQETFDLNELPPGIYILRISNRTGSIQIKVAKG